MLLSRPRDYRADEINAAPSASTDFRSYFAEVNPILNTDSQQEFASRVLEPLYRQLGIDSPEQLETEESAIIMRCSH